MLYSFLLVSNYPRYFGLKPNQAFSPSFGQFLKISIINSAACQIDYPSSGAFIRAETGPKLKRSRKAALAQFFDPVETHSA